MKSLPSILKSNFFVASVFMVLALILGVRFYMNIEFPIGLDAYVTKAYYGQFGPLAIAVELFFAGISLFKKHAKTNFALALFGFTAILDPLFDLFGLFSSSVPLYATILFLGCAIVSLWLAFSNTYNLGRITLMSAVISFILGNAVELFFNYL